MEKYKIAYNNRVRRDKRRQEEETKKQQEDDDEKFAVIRTANTQMTLANGKLTEQNKELQEHVDLLLDENDEKDKRARQHPDEPRETSTQQQPARRRTRRPRRLGSRERSSRRRRLRLAS